nr:endoribonuclease dicer like 3 [Quercus suber]
MIVLAIHTGKTYSLVEVVNNTSAESPFDGNTDNASSKYMTFSEYFNKKYGIPLMHPGQPLLQLKQSHNPHNLLVNFNEEDLSNPNTSNNPNQPFGFNLLVNIRANFDYAKGDGKDLETSFTNLTQPLTESEESELIFKYHFLTILLPIDRFAEMGPSSRTFFSDNGFTCLQVLDHIYAFYQDNMSVHKIEAAIHTDSRHADRLRSVYFSRETSECGYVVFKWIDFLGSRKSLLSVEACQWGHQQ